jgi:hypothetical protein
MSSYPTDNCFPVYGRFLRLVATIVALANFPEESERSMILKLFSRTFSHIPLESESANRT